MLISAREIRWAILSGVVCLALMGVVACSEEVEDRPLDGMDWMVGPDASLGEDGSLFDGAGDAPSDVNVHTDSKTDTGTVEDGDVGSDMAGITCSVNVPCSEGQFCRLATGECLPLVEKSCSVDNTSGCYGFRAFSTPGGTTSVSTCTQQAVQSAMDGATAAGGGVVEIDAVACPKIDINRLKLRSNVILDGGGTTFVVLKGAISDPQLGIITDNFGSTGTAVSNIVARNFTLECAATDDLGILTTGDSGATNVLIEHLSVIGASRNSIDLHGCYNCTARYNQVYGQLPASTHTAGHGINTGQGGGEHRVQIYSNDIHDLTTTGFYGMDIHQQSSSVEIAGNAMADLRLGTKVIGGSTDIYFHHNNWDRIEGPVFVQYSHADVDRIVNFRVHHEAISNAGAAFRLTWGTAGVWQIEGLELWYNEITDATYTDGCTTALRAKTTGVSVRGSHGNICTIGTPVELTCDADPPCDEIP